LRPFIRIEGGHSAAGCGRIGMHLVSACEQCVRIDGHVLWSRDGEIIHTKRSYKYIGRTSFYGLPPGQGFSRCAAGWIRRVCSARTTLELRP
jgi:hypothetical protein